MFIIIAIVFCIFIQNNYAQKSKLVKIDGKLVAIPENPVIKKSDTVDLNLTVSEEVLRNYPKDVDSFISNPFSLTINFFIDVFDNSTSSSSIFNLILSFNFVSIKSNKNWNG